MLNVLSFPGGFGNFYHLDGIGYGIKLDEIKKYHKDSKTKTVVNLQKIINKKNHQENYIYDFIEMVKKTGSSVIYDANVISSNPKEILQIIKLFLDNDIKLLGVELGGELSNRSYSHFMNIEKYISLAELYANSIREVYKDIPIAVVAAPNNRGSSRLENWNNKLAKEEFYDAITKSIQFRRGVKLAKNNDGMVSITKGDRYISIKMIGDDKVRIVDTGDKVFADKVIQKFETSSP